MRLEAERQQSKSAHERGVRYSSGLMESFVGAVVEPRPRHDAACERPAEESRSIHDQSDEPHSPSDRLHHCLCPSCCRRVLDRLRSTSVPRTGKPNVHKRDRSNHLRPDWSDLRPEKCYFEAVYRRSKTDDRISGTGASRRAVYVARDRHQNDCHYYHSHVFKLPDREDRLNRVYVFHFSTHTNTVHPCKYKHTTLSDDAERRMRIDGDWQRRRAFAMWEKCA